MPASIGSSEFFFGTNILLYADDADAQGKSEIARSLLGNAMITPQGILSTQILQKYYVNTRRKFA
jgi:predicted nucleic acid-binding protein